MTASPFTAAKWADADSAFAAIIAARSDRSAAMASRLVESGCKDFNRLSAILSAAVILTARLSEEWDDGDVEPSLTAFGDLVRIATSIDATPELSLRAFSA